MGLERQQGPPPFRPTLRQTRHGTCVLLRIGPWSHAEVRNGGFPDWLLTKAPQTRSNDPAYLHYVDLYDQQCPAEQLKGA